MSLILDALTRAERDKTDAATLSSASTPDSPAASNTTPASEPATSAVLGGTVPAPTPAHSPSRASPWIRLGIVAAVLIMLFVMTFGAYRFLTSGPKLETVEVQERADAVDDAVTGTRVSGAAALPVLRNVKEASPISTAYDPAASSGAGVKEREAAVAALYADERRREIANSDSRMAPELALNASELAKRDESSAKLSSDVESASASSVEASRDAATAESLVQSEAEEADIADRGVAPPEEVIDLDRVLREIRAEAAAAELEPNPVPVLDRLSKQFRDSVPTLMYLRHDFNPSGVSTVLINGAELREGGRSRGVEVRRILPDSAIFRFEGREFRLRALNSWVNL